MDVEGGKLLSGRWMVETVFSFDFDPAPALRAPRSAFRLDSSTSERTAGR
jgi:hypothetical protein